MLLAVLRDLLGGLDGRLVCGPEVDPGPDSRVNDLLDGVRDSGEAARPPSYVRVAPSELVRAEELLEGLADRAAEAEMARGVLRVRRISDERQPICVRLGPAVAVCIRLPDRRDRAPEGVVRLLVPDGDEGIGNGQIDLGEQARVLDERDTVRG